MLESLRDSLTDLFFPPRCFGCGVHLLPDERHQRCCGPCAHSVSLVESPLCPRCALPRESPAGVDALCADCITRRPAFDAVEAFFVYDGAVSDSIRRSKASADPASMLDLARGAADWFARLARTREGACWTTPPPHPRALSSRGWDPALTVARFLARQTGVRWQHPLVRVRHAPRKQAFLGRDERRRSLRGAYEARTGVEGSWIVFDDVLTTGATMDATARALKAAGADSVHGVVLARTS